MSKEEKVTAAPEIVSYQQIAERCEVSVEAVKNWRKRYPGVFPEAVAPGRYYWREVEEFVAKHKRANGRPKSTEPAK